MKFVIRRTPLGFETYLFWDSALARVPEVLDLRSIKPALSSLTKREMSQTQDLPTIPHANAAFVISDEKLLAVN